MPARVRLLPAAIIAASVFFARCLANLPAAPKSRPSLRVTAEESLPPASDPAVAETSSSSLSSAGAAGTFSATYVAGLPVLVAKRHRGADHHHARRQRSPAQYGPAQPIGSLRARRECEARSRAWRATTPPGNRRIPPDAAARGHVRDHSMISRRTQSTGRDQDGPRASPVACKRCCTIFGSCSIFLSPLRGSAFTLAYPGLAPWAAFLRRFAALRRRSCQPEQPEAFSLHQTSEVSVRHRQSTPDGRGPTSDARTSPFLSENV